MNFHWCLASNPCWDPKSRFHQRVFDFGQFENLYPLATDAAGQDLTLVGRIRQDESIPNGINMWIVADNIRKGAATNTVQIAQILANDYLS